MQSGRQIYSQSEEEGGDMVAGSSFFSQTALFA